MPRAPHGTLTAAAALCRKRLGTPPGSGGRGFRRDVDLDLRERLAEDVDLHGVDADRLDHIAASLREVLAR